MKYVLCIILIKLLFMIGCAGPSSPFGAFNVLFPKEKYSLPKTPIIPSQNFSRIEFLPERQVFHRKQGLQVRFDHHKKLSDANLKVFYKDFDITSQFFSRSYSLQGEFTNSKIYQVDSLRFREGDRSSLSFMLFNDYGAPLFTERYLPPYCDLHSKGKIKTTEKYEPGPVVINAINSWSNTYDFNPGLMAGLIAQESAFDPKAVSWAKALGLTQITPIAEKEIRKSYIFTPRSKKVEKYSALVLKGLIKTGRLTENEDWRLNPIKSIKGGFLHLSYIENYWMGKREQRLLNNIYKDSPVPMSDIILASYNSGPYRVKRALRVRGKNFLSHPKLREARKYVLKVSSLCYHFTHGRDL